MKHVYGGTGIVRFTPGQEPDNCLCGRPFVSVLHPPIAPAWPSHARHTARTWLYATLILFATYVTTTVLFGPGWTRSLLGAAALCYAVRSYWRGWADRAELEQHYHTHHHTPQREPQ